MAKICNSATYTLKETFEGTYFSVPDYQREYTWSHDKEVEDLYNDLIENYENNPDKAYLLGPIVTLQTPLHKPNEIVDGQQRLITLTLLFCAIRNALKKYIPKLKDDKEDYDDLVSKIDKSIIDENNKPHIKLNNDRDNEFFEKICTRKHIPDRGVRPKSNVINNYYELFGRINKLFDKYFQDKKDRERIRTVEKMFDNIRDNTCLVYIEITNDEYVYQVFQSLNSKGKKLRQADLIKSYLLSKCPEKVKDKWRKIMDPKSISDNPDDFLYYSVLSRNCDADISKMNLYNHIRDNIKTQEDVGKYLEELIEDSEIIRVLYDPYMLYTDQSSKSTYYVHLLYGMRQINAKYFQRPVIAAYREWGLDNDKTRQLLDCLIKFFFMYRTICKLDIDRIKRISKDVTCAIIAGKELDEIFYKILKNKTINRIENNIEQKRFLDEFKNNTDGLTKNVIKYILYSLEHQLQSRQGTQMLEKFELEHIFPQKPKENDWPNRDELKKHTKRLGNITLLDHQWNASRNNRSFEDKMKAGDKCYKKSGLELNKQYLVNYEQWDIKKIEDREARLLEMAKKIWNLDEYVKKAEKYKLET